MIKIFVINLKRSIERRESIVSQMKKCDLPFELFEAVDGKDIGKDTLLKIHSAGASFKKMYGQNMERGEAGAAMSHLALYKKIVREKIVCAIILEDDAEFDERLKHIAESRDKLRKVFKYYELVLLGYCRNDLVYTNNADCSVWNKIVVDSVIKVGRPLHWYWSAIGYLITLEGARKLLAQGEYPKMQADFVTANSPYYNVRLGVITSPIIWPSLLSEMSTIRNFNEKLRLKKKEPNTGVLKLLKEKIRLFKRKVSLKHYPFLVKLERKFNK